VVRYDGKKVDDFEGLTALIAQHAPGEVSEMEVLRGPNVVKKKVTLGEWE
jgi:S1-C subfamily serine protease